jgi:hypothetical protein
MNIQFRTNSTYVPIRRATPSQSQNINQENYKEIDVNSENRDEKEKKEKIDIKNATYEEMHTVLNEISREKGTVELRLEIDKTSFIQQMREFLNSPRNPNPSMKLVVEGNPMFEGYEGVRSNWIELYERKANQQLELGNRAGYETFMKYSSELKEYYEKNL